MQGVPDQPRLVAGEILAAEASSRVQFSRSEDETASQANDDFAGFGATDSGRRKAGPLLFWSTGLLAAFLVFWISGGHSIVLDPLAETIRNAPAQALQIENVTSRVERRDGAAHLLVDGSARNRGSEALSLPPIVIAVSETDGPTLRYYLGTNQAVLAPGEAYGFSSRLDVPKSGVASVSITFQEGSR